MCEWEELPVADALIIAVAHAQYRAMDRALLLQKMREDGALIDVKSAFTPAEFARNNIRFWRI